MMPSWKKENMQLKNGKVKTELILIVTDDISCNRATSLFDNSLSKRGQETLQPIYPLSSHFPVEKELEDNRIREERV